MANGTATAISQSAVNREGGLVGSGPEIAESVRRVLNGHSMRRRDLVLVSRADWNACLADLGRALHSPE